MAHKLKIVLKDTEPKITRTVIVPEKFNFNDLHVVIQCIMNWNDSHLYQFNLSAPYASDSIRLKNEESNLFGFQRNKQYDATKMHLSDFFNGQKKNMNYIYDFGNDWIHTITVLKKPNEEVLYPKCIKGENAAPIEDCGGVWGFYELLEIISKKRKTTEDKEMLEWARIPKGKSYEDIYAFDIDEVNQRLIDAFR